MLFRELMNFASPCSCIFFFQAEEGIRGQVRSRGLGDVYKGKVKTRGALGRGATRRALRRPGAGGGGGGGRAWNCPLYPSDPSDDPRC